MGRPQKTENFKQFMPQIKNERDIYTYSSNILAKMFKNTKTKTLKTKKIWDRGNLGFFFHFF